MSEISVLERSLVRVMDGQDPEPGWDNPRFGGHKAYLDGVYSGNWQPLQNSVVLWTGEVNTWNPIAGREWWVDFFEHQLGIRVVRKSARGWMGNEPFTSIYEDKFVGTVLSVYEWARRNGDEELADLARQWLRVCWIWKALTSLPVRPRNNFFEGHYPRLGSGWGCPCACSRGFSRSKEDGARVGDPQWLDAPPRATWLLPEVMNERPESGSGFLWDVIQRCDLWRGLDQRLAMDLAALVDGDPYPIRHDRLDDLPPIRGSVRIRRYEHGIATWAESMEGWSSATAPLEATVLHDDGRIEYLASNSGSRSGVRMGAKVEEDGGSLITDGTSSGLYEHKVDRWMSVKLPEGDLRWDLRWNHQGARLVTDSDETLPIAEDPPGGSAGPAFPPDDRRLPPGWPNVRLDNDRDEWLRIIAERAQRAYRDEDNGPWGDLLWAVNKARAGERPPRPNEGERP